MMGSLQVNRSHKVTVFTSPFWLNIKNACKIYSIPVTKWEHSDTHRNHDYPLRLVAISGLYKSTFDARAIGRFKLRMNSILWIISCVFYGVRPIFYSYN
jgi:hypothetical protein